MRFTYESSYISGGDMSGNITGPAQDLSYIIGYAVHAIWTGTPTGNVTLQCSNDGITWKDISSTITATGGASGSVLLNITDAMYKKVRLTYTRTSGTGTLDVNFMGKGA